MKEFLSREGHRFEVRNVDEDEGAYDELLALGVRSVPATTIGDQLVIGFDPARLRAALQTGGGGS